MRLFVAVDVPEHLSRAIDRDVVGALQDVPGARWTRPQGRHLTLAFLGESDAVDAVGDALSAVTVQPFEARFDRVGGFPNLARPRILWVGFGEGAEGFASLAGDVGRVLEPLGFVPDAKPYRAHVTIARFKRPAPIGVLPPVAVPDEVFVVDGFVLYRSELHPQGARYTPLRRF